MIRTRGLSYRYATGGTAPLRFPDVDLRQGGTLLLRGRSGSGKSTWLSLIAGLRGASGGDLFVAGTQLGTQRGAEMDAWRARSIGFLPQKLHLSSALTVADNLALVYFAAGLPRDDAANSTCGASSTARASATRCACPPESWCGLRPASSATPTWARAWAMAASSRGRPAAK